MNYQQLDRIADLCNPVCMVALLVLAFATLKNSAWPWLLRSGLAVIVTQQVSKFVQKKTAWDHHFPSTHFAVALALGVSLVFLKPKQWPVALTYCLAYGALMLAQNYHTPLEMLGACFAIPLALAFHFRVRKARQNVH